jgi:hypothetical protein
MCVQRDSGLWHLRRRDTRSGAGGVYGPAGPDHLVYFTFVRLVETSVENVVFLRRIEAIRRYYATLDPAAAAFFSPGQQSVAAALASTGMRAGLIEMFFTGASMIAAVTSILVGVGAALLLHAGGVPLFAAVLAGVGAALVAYGLHMLWMYRRGKPAMA